MLSSQLFVRGFAALLIAAVARAQTSVQWVGGTSTDFALAANWNPTGTPNATQVALFSTATSNQPALLGPASVVGLSFAADAPSYSLSGVSLLSIGSSGILNQSTSLQTISVPLSFNTAAPAIVNSGNLTISGPISNSATPGVTLSGTGVGTISGNIGGPGALTKSGSGTWTLSGANTYGGTTTVSQGTLGLSANGALPLGGAVVVNATSASAKLDLAGTTQTTGSLTFGGTGAGSGLDNSVTMTTGGVLNLNGNVTFDATNNPNTAQIQGGTLNLGAATRTFNVGDSSNTQVDLSINSVVTGTGGLNKQGLGVLSLAGANDYTGATTITGGALAVTSLANGGVNSGIGKSTNVASNLILNGGALNYAGSGDQVTDRLFTLGSGSTIGVNSGAGALSFSNPGPIAFIVANMSGLLTLVADQSGYNFFAPVIANNGTGIVSLQKKGYGTWVLTGANTYTGGTTISDSGTLLIGNGGVTGSIAGNVFLNSGALVFKRSDTVTFAGNITGNGTFMQEGAGTLVLTGASNFTGTTQVGAGATLQIGDGGTIGSLNSSLQNSGTLIFNRSDKATFGGWLYGSGALVKKGANTLTLTYGAGIAGSTSIEDGVFEVSGSGFSSNSSLTLGTSTTNATLRSIGSVGTRFNGAVNLLGATSTVDAGFSGEIDLPGAISTSTAGLKTLTLNAGNNSYANDLNGAITDGAGTVAIVKTGGGVWRMSNYFNSHTSTYTGGTTINGGRLDIFGTNALPAGSSVVINAKNSPEAELQIVDGSHTIGSLTFGGAGGSAYAHNSVYISTGTLVLGGNVAYSVVDPVNAPSGAYFSGGTVDLGTANHTFTVDRSSHAQKDLSIYSNVSGTTGGIVKEGAGILALEGGNTFGGNIALNAGTLLLGSDAAAGSGTGTIIVASGAKLGAYDQSYYPSGYDVAVVVSNPVTLASGATLGALGQFRDASLRLNGTVTANAASTTVHLNADSPPTILTGALTGTNAGTAVTFDGGGMVALAGTFDVTKISSVTANGAAILFARDGAVPSGLGPTLQATNGGYIGIAKTEFGSSAPSAAAVLNAITDKANFNGTFGFDTHTASGTAGAPFEFAFSTTTPLDLSGFGTNPNFTLGSVSMAVLSGPAGSIKPGGLGYTFGNGGGGLFVKTALDGNNAVAVKSNNATAAPLAVIFSGDNTYQGNLSVKNSVAILDSPNALPATRTAALDVNGYLGFTDFAGSPGFAASAARVTSYTPTSVLGLDSHSYLQDVVISGESYSSAYITETIDLSGFGPIGLGTATRALILGPVIAPNKVGSGANKSLTLLAVNQDADLSIVSPLLAANVGQVTIGSATGPWRNGNVHLFGDNTYTGGTTLAGGVLALDHGSRRDTAGNIVAGPLGTGTLTVAAAALSPVLTTDYYGGDILLHNAITLNGRLQLGTPQASMPTTVSGMAVAAITEGIGSWLTDLNLAGAIGGIGGLDIYGNIALNGANTFGGGVNFRQGTLTLGTDSALGTGTFAVSPENYSYLYVNVPNGATRTLGNPVSLSSGHSELQLHFSGNGNLTFTGPVTLNGAISLTADQVPVRFNGGIAGGQLMARYGARPVYIGGTSATNTYSGGTMAYYGGKVVFDSAGAIPTNGMLQAGYDGYIGVASNTFATSLQSNFIDRFSKGGTNGTIGFDSPVGGGTPTTFGGSISLFGFNSEVRLGSASSAILTGAITPQGDEYRFGGGGGHLEVNSGLVDGAATYGRTLDVNSTPSDPLTLRVGGTNTYSGGDGLSTWVYSSALIFKQGSMPASASIRVTEGGYVGTEDVAHFSATGSFLDKLYSSSNEAVIGFDSYTGTANVTGPISLTGFYYGGADPKIYLGTSTSAILSGAITLPTGQTTYRFAGYKGGQLTVATPLGGTGGVEIAAQDIFATVGSPTNPTGPLSSVTLTGDNTYGGGTILNGGKLLVGRDSALGTATLTVREPYVESWGVPLPSSPFLGAAAAADPVSGSPINLLNPVYLSSADLTLGGANTFKLSGAITGYGEIYKTGTSTVTLAGSNTFDGGVYVSQGNLTFATAASVGSGPVKLGGPLGPSVTFSSSSLVNGISADNATDQILLGTGVTLTVNPLSDAGFLGTISSPGGSMIYQGNVSDPVHLRLAGANNYNGGTTINSGITVVASNSGAFGPATTTANAVTLNGGKLVLDTGVTLSNALTATRGALGGIGTFQLPATLTVGGTTTAHVTLAPGMGGPGTLQFSNANTLLGSSPVLTLAGGGEYHWQISDAAMTTGTWDKVSVTGAVNISATSVNPFTFTIAPMGPFDLMSTIANFNPNLNYAWSVITATSITGFNASAFTIDATAIGSFLPPSSTFFMTLSGGNTLMLNFSPVPEPSTYALLGLGAIVLVLAQRRRRR